MKIELDNGNFLQIEKDILTPSDLESFRELVHKYKPTFSQPTTQTFGHRPKFTEMTFDVPPFNTGVPAMGYPHTLMPHDVKQFCALIKTRFDGIVGEDFGGRLFNANMVHYTPRFDRGGGRGVHSDNPDEPLSLVLIYTIGQTRTLKIYREGKVVTKVPLEQNSVVAMVGRTFQTMYKHCVAKLPPSVTPGHRYSLNIRYMRTPSPPANPVVRFVTVYRNQPSGVTKKQGGVKVKKEGGVKVKKEGGVKVKKEGDVKVKKEGDVCVLTDLM